MLKTYSADFILDMGPELGSHYTGMFPELKATVVKVIRQYKDQGVIGRLLGIGDGQSLAEYEEAWAPPLESYINRSGKCLRPYLVSLLLEAYGHQPTDWPLEVALAEIIHSSSLILDDIADNSVYRRGELTAHKLYGAAIAGASACGWLNLGATLIWEDRERLGPEATGKLLHELAWEHFVTGIGTAVDVTWAWRRTGQFSAATYLQQVVHRSTSYTYRLPLKIGCITAGAPKEDTRLLARFGEVLGLAFQLKDDMLNAEADDKSWGKEIGEDILEGKFTLQIIHALEHASSIEREELLGILGSRTSDPDAVSRVVKILRTTGAFEYCQSLANNYCHQSKSCIGSLSIAPVYKKMLTDFADYIIERNR